MLIAISSFEKLRIRYRIFVKGLAGSLARLQIEKTYVLQPASQSTTDWVDHADSGVFR